MKRWWGIRHLRWAWAAYRLACWVRFWQREAGAMHASEYDLAYLDAIWEGRG